MRKAPIPADHHRTRIRHRTGDGKFKAPPSGAGTGAGDEPDAGDVSDIDAPLSRDPGTGIIGGGSSWDGGDGDGCA